MKLKSLIKKAVKHRRVIIAAAALVAPGVVSKGAKVARRLYKTRQKQAHLIVAAEAAPNAVAQVR